MVASVVEPLKNYKWNDFTKIDFYRNVPGIVWNEGKKIVNKSIIENDSWLKTYYEQRPGLWT